MTKKPPPPKRGGSPILPRKRFLQQKPWKKNLESKVQITGKNWGVVHGNWRREKTRKGKKATTDRKDPGKITEGAPRQKSGEEMAFH